MNQPPTSPQHDPPRQPRRSMAVVLAVALFFLSGASPAFALDAPDRFSQEPPQPSRWQSQGMGIFPLPLGFQVRFETNYSRFTSRSDGLASRFLGRYEALTGPGRIIQRSLDSRLSLSHPLWEHVDLEIAWETRNRVAVSEPMQIERHTIGALIRITP